MAGFWTSMYHDRPFGGKAPSVGVEVPVYPWRVPVGTDSLRLSIARCAMKRLWLFAIGDHLERLWVTGDRLKTPGRIAYSEAFGTALGAGLGCSDGTKDGRPPYDPLPMFKC